MALEVPWGEVLDVTPQGFLAIVVEDNAGSHLSQFALVTIESCGTAADAEGERPAAASQSAGGRGIEQVDCRRAENAAQNTVTSRQCGCQRVQNQQKTALPLGAWNQLEIYHGQRSQGAERADHELGHIQAGNI